MKSYKHNRIRKAGNLSDLQLRLWQAVDRAEEILLTDEDVDRQLKAIHALSSVAGQYLKIFEVSELEKRLVVLEEMLMADR